MKYLKEIRFRLTAEEKSALCTIAAGEDLSQSAYVRQLLNKEAKKLGLLSSKPTKRIKAGRKVAKAA